MTRLNLKGGAEDTTEGSMVTRTKNSLLTTTDVAKMLNLHINTVRRWSNRGILKPYRIGPRCDRRFRREDIVAFLNSQQTPVL